MWILLFIFVIVGVLYVKSVFCLHSYVQHKFIIRFVSSCETLNRIKDNKLKISGWAIYDCGDFTLHGYASFQISPEKYKTKQLKYS